MLEAKLADAYSRAELAEWLDREEMLLLLSNSALFDRARTCQSVTERPVARSVAELS
jgi:hypothetical protein